MLKSRPAAADKQGSPVRQLPPVKRCLARLVLAALPLCLAGCDMLGIESASDIAAKRDAEGKAIGGACRYSARPIEQCFELNKHADKAAMFAGWREMNDYMRDNKIDPMPADGQATVAVAAAGTPPEGGTDKAEKTDKTAGPAGKSGTTGSAAKATAKPP